MPKRGIGDRAEVCIAALADRERITFVEALGRPADARDRDAVGHLHQDSLRSGGSEPSRDSDDLRAGVDRR